MTKKIIAIGALGGSGTRVVAEIISEMGYFIGDELNDALDNLTFTALFKDKVLFSDYNLLSKRMIVFDKYMSNIKLSRDDIRIYNESNGNLFLSFKRRSLMKIKLKINNLTEKEARNEYAFKEPNSIHFIDKYLTTFPNLKFIYVLRHGLDMAFSSNKGQLSNFGSFYGLENNVGSLNDSSDEAAKQQLEFWIRMSKKVNDLIEKYGDRIHVINHSSLCEEPVLEINRLADFLNINLPDNDIARMSTIPKKPSSSGRYLNEDLRVFDKDQILYVKSQGFKV